MIYHRSSLSYTHVTGSVTIHNLRTVAPRYGELLALLVYLTTTHSSCPPSCLFVVPAGCCLSCCLCRHVSVSTAIHSDVWKRKRVSGKRVSVSTAFYFDVMETETSFWEMCFHFHVTVSFTRESVCAWSIVQTMIPPKKGG